MAEKWRIRHKSTFPEFAARSTSRWTGGDWLAWRLWGRGRRLEREQELISKSRDTHLVALVSNSAAFYRESRVTW
jgi:hypothetical protein